MTEKNKLRKKKQRKTKQNMNSTSRNVSNVNVGRAMKKRSSSFENDPKKCRKLEKLFLENSLR